LVRRPRPYGREGSKGGKESRESARVEAVAHFVLAAELGEIGPAQLARPSRRLGLLRDALAEYVEETAADAAEALADSLRRCPEDLCELGGVEAVDVAEDQEGALVGLEVSLEEVANGDSAWWVGRRLLKQRRESAQSGLAPAPRSERVQGAIAGDREQPGSDVLDLMQLLPLLKGDEERLLEKVLGKAASANHLYEKQAEPALVCGDDQVELALLSLLGGILWRGHKRKVPHGAPL
jgi:hypothetical protein